MRLGQYAVVHAREHDDIVYRIDMIPARGIYKVSFSDYRIPPFYGDKGDRVTDLEREAQEIIDEFKSKNK